MSNQYEIVIKREDLYEQVRQTPATFAAERPLPSRIFERAALMKDEGFGDFS